MNNICVVCALSVVNNFDFVTMAGTAEQTWQSENAVVQLFDGLKYLI
jgi:hypothetical protein